MTHYTPQEEAIRRRAPRDKRGGIIQSVHDAVHIEEGDATPEDVRVEELSNFEKLMEQPPVPLSQIGHAHNKWQSPQMGFHAEHPNWMQSAVRRPR